MTAPTPDLYIGKGNAADPALWREELGATLVLFDEELTARQGKHLDDALGPRNPDETQLVTDRRNIPKRIGVLTGQLVEVGEQRRQLRDRTEC